MSAQPSDVTLQRSWEELEFKERKLQEYEARLNARAQELSTLPPKKDLVAEAAVDTARQQVVQAGKDLALKERNVLVRASALDEESRAILAQKQANEATARVHAIAAEQLRLREIAVAEREDALAGREQRLRDQAESVRAQEVALTQATRAWETSSRQTAKQQEDAERRITGKQEALSNEQQAHQRRVERVEAEQAERDRKLSDREGKLQQLGLHLSTREQAVHDAEQALRGREQAVIQGKAKQEVEALRLTNMVRALDIREMHLEKRERQVKQLVEQHQLQRELAASG